MHKVIGAIVLAAVVAAAVLLPLAGLPLARRGGTSASTSSSSSESAGVIEHTVEHTTVINYAPNWVICLPLAALLLLGLILLLLPHHQPGT